MSTKKVFKSAVVMILLIFSFEIAFFSPTVFPQTINRVEDNIGGSGFTTPSEDSGNSKTFLYIAAGVIIVGLIVWKIILDRKKPKAKDKENSDSTNVSLSGFPYKTLSDQELQLERIQNQIPFEIFLGFQGDEKTFPERSLAFGLKIRL